MRLHCDISILDSKPTGISKALVKNGLLRRNDIIEQYGRKARILEIVDIKERTSCEVAHPGDTVIIKTSVPLKSGIRTISYPTEAIDVAMVLLGAYYLKEDLVSCENIKRLRPFVEQNMLKLCSNTQFAEGLWDLLKSIKGFSLGLLGKISKSIIFSAINSIASECMSSDKKWECIKSKIPLLKRIVTSAQSECNKVEDPNKRKECLENMKEADREIQSLTKQAQKMEKVEK